MSASNGASSGSQDAGHSVEAAPELADLLEAQNRRLHERIVRERNQRQVWLQQEQQTVQSASEQQQQVNAGVYVCSRTAERQRAQLDEALDMLRLLAQRPQRQAPGSRSERSTLERGNSGSALAPPSTWRPPRLRRGRSLLWRESTESPAGRVVTSPAFDAFIATVICANAIIIGVGTQYELSVALRALLRTLPTEQIDLSNQHPVFRVLGYMFFGVYTVELLLKLHVYRLNFFWNENRRWNIFDAFLVLTAAYDIILDMVNSSSSSSGTGMTWMRVLRLLKMLKMLRVIRVMKFFRELRIMLHSIVGSVRILFWSILMLLLIMYIFGLCFLQAVIGYFLDIPAEDVNPDVEDAIADYWGSVPAAMLTLWMAISGGSDWEVVAEPLKEAGVHYFGLFLFYIAFLSFAVLNVLTGIFVDQAMQIASLDRDNVVNEEVIRETAFRADMQQLFDTIDVNGNGFVTWSEFKGHLHNESVRSHFKAMNLDMSDAKTLFTLMDNDGANGIDINEFVIGCTKLKGTARSIDLVTLMRDTKRYMHRLGQFMWYVEDWFQEVHRQFLPRAGQGKVKSLRVRLTRRGGRASVSVPQED